MAERQNHASAQFGLCDIASTVIFIGMPIWAGTVRPKHGRPIPLQFLRPEAFFAKPEAPGGVEVVADSSYWRFCFCTSSVNRSTPARLFDTGFSKNK